MSDAQLVAAAARLRTHPLEQPPPLDQVEGRAARLRLRRRCAVVAAGGAVAAATVVVVSWIWSSPPSLEVRTLAPAAPGGEGPARVAPVDEAPPQGGARTTDEPEPMAASPASSGDAPITSPETSAEWEGCRAFSRPGSDGPPFVATGEEEAVRSCSYRATRPGGYEGAGTWTLEIDRNGERIVLDSLGSAPCAAAVIRPGDVVTARLGARGTSGTPASASAGRGEWHLTVGSGIGCP